MDRTSHPGYYMSNWPVTGRGEEVLGSRIAYHYPHISPQSVLVIAISNMWEENGWHRLQDMLLHTERAGHTIAFQEVDDISLMPTDAIGSMRSCAALMALDSGMEWLLMVDTDTLLEPDTLVRLLRWDRPIVFPLLKDLEQKYPGTTMSFPPDLEPNNGLLPVCWAAMSVMLFNVKVFNALPSYAWHGSDFHFGQHLNHVGHRMYVDTDTVVGVSRGPSRYRARTWEEVWDGIRKTFDRNRYDDRDRRPPPDFDAVFGDGTVTGAGTYLSLPNRSRMNNGFQDIPKDK